MNALDYILNRYQLPKYEKSPKERAVLRALVHTLKPEELMVLQKKLKRSSSKWNVGTDLYKEVIKAENNNTLQRNEPVSILLKQFTDKRSGKVAVARKKLHDRFEKQDFQTQRKIIHAFLSSAKQDRIWAFNRLKGNWDSTCYNIVKALWEQYHEKECGQVVLRYFPTEYVYNNLLYLDTDENYTWLCIRLINHPQFKIEKEHLGEGEHFLFYGRSDVEYLYVLAKSGSEIQKGEATRIMFEQIIDYLNCCGWNIYKSVPTKLKERFRDVQYYENYYPTTKWFDVVSHILWCMGRLGLTEELIAFEEWDSMVQRRLISKTEYDELIQYHVANFVEECFQLFLDTIAECLPDKYKSLIRFSYALVDTAKKQTKMSIADLKGNPIINDLIDKLGLEEVTR